MEQRKVRRQAYVLEINKTLTKNKQTTTNDDNKTLNIQNTENTVPQKAFISPLIFNSENKSWCATSFFSHTDIRRFSI